MRAFISKEVTLYIGIHWNSPFCMLKIPGCLWHLQVGLGKVPLQPSRVTANHANKSELDELEMMDQISLRQHPIQNSFYTITESHLITWTIFHSPYGIHVPYKLAMENHSQYCLAMVPTL